ncbi:MAG: pilus assembly FimT family protein [Smithellaceae bacterium]
MFDQNQEQGFTLIEIIAVLILIGILGAVVFSRVTSTAEVDLKVKAEQVKGHIRYAQMRAMNTTSATTGCNAPVGMAAAGGKYYMFIDCNTGNQVVLPGADSTAGVDLPSGSTFPAFSFDTWGRPYANVNAAGTSTSISVSIGGEAITITQNTGYVP